ncbi:amino acid ABC transporter ATP-binding protein, PAAT family (TC 3.A.1.3.-) [Clostridium acidisoli DSM 12555]|uniref:Amino acid ABC transporter ATP-binding protein, PAAT family (TC 3.A.1.3.-) n=1 Tax=Clostridium acidisoli DSM 12555 TaxID=1121291 RepID=A0A1W1XKZ4_9CLOT|nr:amino acid ABC transporter ATP-binding protein [Clostridium acidisoli]SMC24512.1 amino acid ABC transporter ATP-binding protein, PAAT family (TC 3.A.1.3.-) [Clostridium acidisoli DSM 12555]
MIKVENLHKSYGDNEILKGIDLQIETGKIVVIIGPSGAGKSTFLRCLNYLEAPDMGRLRLGDLELDFSKIKKNQILQLRKKTSMVFQRFNLFKNKTALENVEEALIIVKKYSKSEAEKISKDRLINVGLKDKFDSYPSQLSGGQEQRVGIARAMALDPEVILFDEPTSALDPERVFEVLDVIKRLAKNQQTMVIVTHEMNFAREIADKVVFMEEGQIIQTGTPKEIFEDSTNERINQFLKKINVK